MRLLLASLGLMLLLVPAFAADEGKDTVAEIKQKLAAKKAILLDVREKDEWDEGHLQDAQLLPLTKIKAGLDPKALEKEIPKDRIIYCHCRAGSRAIQAADRLGKLGYEVRPLKLGYQELLEAGMPKATK